MDIALNNACYVYNEHFTLNEPATKRVTRLEYRQIVARNMIGKYSNRKRNAPTSASGKFSIDAAPKPTHYVEQISERKRYIQCKNKIWTGKPPMFVKLAMYICVTRLIEIIS